MRYVAWFAVLTLISTPTAQAKSRKRRSSPAAGYLKDGVLLPAAGEGYRIPQTWIQRNASWGTPDMIALIERSAAAVSEEIPDSTLYVADISFEHGGASPWHASHQKGCDADLIYYALDDAGNPAPEPSDMHAFDASGDGKSVDDDGKAIAIHFDAPRNWELVKTILADPNVQVQYIFSARWIKTLILAYAKAEGEPQPLIDRATAILQQPTDSLPHDDHMHVRITQCTVGSGTFAEIEKKAAQKTAERQAREAPRP